MVALITGGSSGLGLEFARQLGLRGYDLLLVSNREEELSKAATELQQSTGVKVHTHWSNLATENAADELFSWCHEEGIVPDVLVNNAGMYFFKELDVADLDRVQAMIHLHITTITRLCLLFGQEMKSRGNGYILNVSSMAARLPVPGITIYSATKAYLKSFGKSLSFEYLPYGVGVSTVCPAAVATPLYNIDKKWMNLGLRLRVIHTPEWLVKRALKAMFRRKRIVAPSLMNAYLPLLIALLPSPSEAKLWEKWK